MHKLTLPSQISYSRSIAALWVVLVLALMQGCAVKLIANYDEHTDQALMKLQRSFAEFFLVLEETVGTPASAYDEYRNFYRQVKVDAGALKLRVDAQPLNDISSQAVAKLIDNIGLLEEIHKEGINDIEVVTLIKDDFTLSLTSLLRLELAKQRGDI